MTRSDRIALVLATLAVVSALASCREIVAARNEINRFVGILNPRAKTMQTKEAEWRDANGITRRVITQRLMIGDGWESLKSWCERHDKAVDAEITLHPPG